MTDKQMQQIKTQLPEGERFDRAYRAFEGPIRVISKTADGRETRYTVSFNADDNATITKF